MATKYLFWLPLVVAAGCSFLPQSRELARPPRHLPQHLLQQVTGQEPISAIESVCIEDDEEYREYQITLRRGSADVEFHTVECVEPSARWVVLYPILQSDDAPVMRYIAREVLADEGINSLILTNPPLLYGRTPSIEEFDRENLQLLRKAYSAFEYLNQRNPSRIAQLGTSLGGMQLVGATAFIAHSGLEKKPAVSIIWMAGGNLDEIIAESEEIEPYRDFLLDRYGSEESMKAALRTLRFEPLRYAQYLDTPAMKMIITTWDSHVPTKNQWDLYKALGGPEALTIFSGHYTSVLHYWNIKFFILREIEEAFERAPRLDPVPLHPTRHLRVHP